MRSEYEDCTLQASGSASMASAQGTPLPSAGACHQSGPPAAGMPQLTTITCWVSQWLSVFRMCTAVTVCA